MTLHERAEQLILDIWETGKTDVEAVIIAERHFKAALREVVEDCAKVAESEEEMDGDMPDEIWWCRLCWIASRRPICDSCGLPIE